MIGYSLHDEFLICMHIMSKHNKVVVWTLWQDVVKLLTNRIFHEKCAVFNRNQMNSSFNVGARRQAGRRAGSITVTRDLLLRAYWLRS